MLLFGGRKRSLNTKRQKEGAKEKREERRGEAKIKDNREQKDNNRFYLWSAYSV